MTDRAAVIDLGTNTFHIIIGHRNLQGQLQIDYRRRVYVFLGKDGVDKINADRFELGLKTLHEFKRTLEEAKISNVRVLGTSALRQASNGPKFIEEVFSETGLSIEVIEGALEAQLIFEGILIAKETDEEDHLIMDIGGGSVEFILFRAQEKIWAESFKIGISVLHHLFQKSDPLSNEDQYKLQVYLEETLEPLFTAIEGCNIQTLIGSSGTFEVLSALGHYKEKGRCHSIESEYYTEIYELIMSLELEKRLELENLDKQRAPLIQVAFFLVKFIIDRIGVDDILISPFAMKEGALNKLI